GQVIAFGFIIVGLFRFFNGAGFGGLWLTFIGWFLLDAARSSYAQFETIERLRGIRVRDVMASDWPIIDGKTSLQTFVDDHLLRSAKRCFVVEEDGRVVGMITHDAMLPLTKLHAVKPGTSLTEALETMGRKDVNQLPVMSNTHLDGIISRGHILRLLQTRVELQR
ncbi:MAG: hypothetical protein DMF70_13325, partial [Acidobacteria bacterium]